MRKVEVNTRYSGGTTETRSGLFHGWFPFGENPGILETMAIVEFNDGTVGYFSVHDVRFATPPEAGKGEK